MMNLKIRPFFSLRHMGQIILLLIWAASVTDISLAKGWDKNEPWPDQATKIQFAFAYNLFQYFWNEPFPQQGKTFLGAGFKNTLDPKDIRLLGDYLTKSLLQYLAQDPVLAQEIAPQLIQSARKIKSYCPFESPTFALSKDEQKHLPPRSIVVLRLKQNPPQTYPQSPLGQYLAMLQAEHPAERANLIFDGEMGFKHYNGFFAPQSNSIFVAPQILGQMLEAHHLQEILTNPTLAHEEFHRRQFLLLHQNTATLTTGIMGALEEQRTAALTHLMNTKHLDAFYLEEVYAHSLSLMLLFQQLKTAVADITPNQNDWPTAAAELRGLINQRFQKCIAYITGAWRLNTYVYHAFPQYWEALNENDGENNDNPALPFVGEDKRFYFPVNHTFQGTMDGQGNIDLAYPITFTYYYLLPAAVLAKSSVKPNQKLDDLLVLNLEHLTAIKAFVRQQNAYLQDLAAHIRLLWQYWSAIYYYSPYSFAQAVLQVAAAAKKLPWPRPWPPGKNAYRVSPVIPLARIDNYTADYFLKAPPLEPAYFY